MEVLIPCQLPKYVVWNKSFIRTHYSHITGGTIRRGDIYPCLLGIDTGDGRPLW